MTSLLTVCVASALLANAAAPPLAPPPRWFLDHMEFMTKKSGRWIADNAAYKSETERWDGYGTQWTWGIGRKSIVGRLFGVEDGEEKRTFWEFRVFWHPGDKKAHIHQFGGNGAVSLGTMEPAGEKTIRMKQRSANPRGIVKWLGHVTVDVSDSEQTTQSYDIEGDDWKKRRFYRWKLAVEPEKKRK